MENVENVEGVRFFPTKNSTGSTNSTHLPFQEAVFPEDSILQEWMHFARQYVESADGHLIGSILPVIGAFLGRQVCFFLDRKKFSNLYVMIAGKPGIRKSSAIKLAQQVAVALLPVQHFSPSAMSTEALFDEYDVNCDGSPDKLLIDDDANGVLANWSESSYGKQTSKLYLQLYDCGSLRESFKRNKKETEAKRSRRFIPETSTSILFGATFNVARFQHLEVKDGMRRRFLNYVAEGHGRFIPRPPPFDETAFQNLISKFKSLSQLKGHYQFSPEADALWIEIQKKNRHQLATIPEDGYLDFYASALTEAPSHILKVAMIFAACQWAKDHNRNLLAIEVDTLSLAERHVSLCLESGKYLENIGERADIRSGADAIIARIQKEFDDKRISDAIVLTKSDLTYAFARNPSRSGGMTTARLYHKIIPDLIQRGLAREIAQKGMRTNFAFKLEDDSE